MPKTSSPSRPHRGATSLLWLAGALSVGSALLLACQARSYNTASDANSTRAASALEVHPLDLSFHFPFPSDSETRKLRVSDDLIPKEYFLEYFPQRWFEYHSWLFDAELKDFQGDIVEATRKKKALVERLRRDKAAFAALKETVWNHLYITGVRVEPCFPAMPTEKEEKDFLKCGLHAAFLVAQVVVDGRAYGTANTLATQTKDGIIDLLKDFRRLRDVGGVDTKGLPIHVHPGFLGPNGDAFLTETTRVFRKYFGKSTLFGSAFSAKTIEAEQGNVKEIWNLNANAAPIKFKNGQTSLPEYARTADQLLIIESNGRENGGVKVSVDLDPPSLGRPMKSIWETDIGPGLEKKPKNVKVIDMANLAASEPPSDAMLAAAHAVDDPSKVAINKENCALCHLSAAARYRNAPDSIAPDFRYDAAGVASPENFGNAEKAMHPDILALYRSQAKANRWLPYHHGYAFGSADAIVSPRHINEMFAVSKMVNLMAIPFP